MLFFYMKIEKRQLLIAVSTTGMYGRFFQARVMRRIYMHRYGPGILLLLL